MSAPEVLPLVWRQTVAEQRMFWRNPASSGFTIALPLMLLTIFSLVNGNSDLAVPGVGVVHFASFYLAGIIVMAVLSANFMSLAISLVIRREEGILKRKRGTPLPAWALFAGLVISQTIVSLVMLVLTTAASIAFFDVPFPRHVLLVVLIVIFGSAAFAALGVAATSAITNQDAAPAIVNMVALPVLFLSGVFFPISIDWVRNVSRILPVAPMRNLIFEAYAPPLRRCAEVAGCQAPVTHPSGLSWVDLGILVAWLVVGGVVAITTFRWTRRGE